MIRSTRLVAFGIFAILPLVTVATTAKAETLFALTTGNDLYRFDSATPGTATLLATIALPGSEDILSMDFRATDRQLYVLGAAGNLYSLDATFAPTLVSSALVGVVSGTDYEIDFNPVPNALRILRSDGQNSRLSGGPGLGTFNDDTDYPAGPPRVGDAYTNNDVNPNTGTTLFVLNGGAGSSLIQVTNANNPPAGSLIDRGTLGVTLSAPTPFEISSATGSGYLISGDSLYSVDVTTAGSVDNRATLIGQINGGGLAFKGLAASAAAPEPGTLALLGLGFVGGILARRRAARG
ncbi:MAG: DUF4394 domain-containing protein [Capsulimonadales bacterium]|nr:DUF4394 domain-containing protein [Capsulimonadales bacterium]